MLGSRTLLEAYLERVDRLNPELNTVVSGWCVQAYANNVTNQDMKAFGYFIGFDAPTIYTSGKLWGVSLTFDF